MGQYAETIKLIFFVLIGMAVLFYGNKIMEWREASLQNEARGGTIVSTSGVIADGQRATEDRAKTDAGVTAGKEAYDDSYNKAVTHEPEVSSRSSRTVPVSVRNALHERRLRRERSGCAGSQCEEGAATTTTPER